MRMNLYNMAPRGTHSRGQAPFWTHASLPDSWKCLLWSITWFLEIEKWERNCHRYPRTVTISSTKVTGSLTLIIQLSFQLTSFWLWTWSHFWPRARSALPTFQVFDIQRDWSENTGRFSGNWKITLIVMLAMYLVVLFDVVYGVRLLLYVYLSISCVFYEIKEDICINRRHGPAHNEICLVNYLAYLLSQGFILSSRVFLFQWIWK